MPADQPSVSVSPLRAGVEHRLSPLIYRMQSLPHWVPAVVVVALMVLGVIFRHAVGAICFGVCALLVALLLYLAWPRLAPIERMMRGAVLLLLAAVTVVLAAG